MAFKIFRGLFGGGALKEVKNPTGEELDYSENELIVSRTDTSGRIVYANRLFTKLSGYPEAELLGKPHSVVRHPHMPRIIFRLLWERISAGEEIFAYVVNKSRLGQHYWVLAHVTPTFDNDGKIIGYHSNRRKPARQALEEIKTLYKKLLDAENAQTSRKAGMEASQALLDEYLAEKGISYDEYVLTL